MTRCRRSSVGGIVRVEGAPQEREVMGMEKKP